MQTVQNDADRSRAEAYLKEIAHEVSAEYHRKRGVQFGVATTALSAIVGTAAFGAATKLVISDKGELILPTGAMGSTPFFVVVFLSVLSAVLSAWHQFLKDEAETEKHLSGVRHYSNVTVLLDHFIRTVSNKELGEASSELLDILKNMESPPQPLPILIDKAIKEARRRIAADQISPQ